MKLSFISSNAIQNAMRQTIRQAQNEMTSASTEATTGVYADIGVALGSSTSLNVNLTREVSRIDSILSSNSVANQRMTTSQTALTGMGTQAQNLMDQLVALSGNTDGSSVALAQQAATSTLSGVIASANTMVNGEYLFAGTNTDVQPMTDYSSTANASIQSQLTAYMSSQSPAVTASTISAAQINDFITNTVAPMFTSDTGWANWSSASDQNMTSRINNSEVVETSTNSNSSGMRYLALATSVTNALMGTPPGLNQSAVNAVTQQAISYTRQSIDGLNSQASQLGLSQSRLSDANTTLNAQKTILNTSIGDLTGVDPYEASTKVNSLETQLETAYTIVSKIQQLSLVNYL
ncbi:flagellar hook-associated family protein [Rhizobium sp. NPDC090279]|uniref:flagellar hook-associated family protein n=1 Tax=Rhizobium sp. NPDC090279 TaxID=3364499 RepID=UPI00383BE8E1